MVMVGLGLWLGGQPKSHPTTLGMFTRHSFNGNSFVVSAALVEVL